MLFMLPAKDKDKEGETWSSAYLVTINTHKVETNIYVHNYNLTDDTHTPHRCTCRSAYIYNYSLLATCSVRHEPRPTSTNDLVLEMKLTSSYPLPPFLQPTLVVYLCSDASSLLEITRAGFLTPPP